MNQRLIIGTRSSKLALWQAEYVKSEIEKNFDWLKVELMQMTTKGDKILDAPLAKIGGKGLFTKELEQAMLDKEIDIAVHSLKDMPTEIPSGLCITAITKRLDAGDALVSPKYKTLDALPEGARVGTSSLRRRAQLLAARPDLKLLDLRGNVNTRLKKLDDGAYDAIVLAVAGLKRLGFADRITEILPLSICLPAVGQGALAIETRENDIEVRDMLGFLENEEMEKCALAERSFLAVVEGGCQVPVGVYATPVISSTATNGKALSVEAVIASLDGGTMYRDKITGSMSDAKTLGETLANKLLDAGGINILHDIGLLLDRQ
ncbi:MAG: hydroxymethylbilane synthase [Schwartzia sp.]|nr:hydroxymethylbilane synthase [Schwartzia sp. (in: firmicutes)]